jgi:hypothetical protein
VYWKALREIASSGRGAGAGTRSGVPVPRPHPKFTAADAERIAREGPRFGDVVLEHAERVAGGEGALCFVDTCFFEHACMTHAPTNH